MEFSDRATDHAAVSADSPGQATAEDRARTIAEALFRDETVETQIEGKQRLIRLLNPELGLINTRDPIGLYVAASGPRGPSSSDGDARISWYGPTGVST